ncbi:hypothetical protein D3260_07970 [Salinisphaera sp. Q1T1-3]|nr:hypothetical protein D3260_07970 [Salinisphaera sp. Q1T1-3]
MNKTVAGIGLLTSVLAAQAAIAADTMFEPGESETTTWTTLSQSDHKNKKIVGALSEDKSMEMQFTFEQLIGRPQLFLGILDVPAKTCGQDREKGKLSLKAPTAAEAMTVDGKQYPATIDCTEGHTNYAFHGQAAAHAITEALRHGKSVTIGVPSGDGRVEHTWSATNFDKIADDRVEAYENSASFHGQ